MSATAEIEEQVFSLSPKVINLIRRRFAVIGVVITVLMAGFLWAITDPAFWHTGGKAIGTATLIAGAMALGLYRGYRQQRRVWATARFAVGPAGVTFTAAGSAAWSIPWAEVASAVEFKSSGLQLMTTGGRRLDMPSTLVDYNAARQAVSRRVTLTTAPDNSAGAQWVKVIAAMTGVVLGMTVTFRNSTPPRVVVPIGLGLIAMLVWCMWAMLRGPTADARSKRFAWMIFLTVLVIALRIVAAVAGWTHAG